MILTLFILNQLLLPGYKPVAVLHQEPVQGIVLHQEPVKPVATFKLEQPKGIVIHQDPIKGIPLTQPKITPVATWTIE